MELAEKQSGRVLKMIKEDLHTEFKQSFNEDVIVTLVAFANAKGGTVYVGMRDDGRPCGVTIAQESVQQWINEIKQKTEPAIIPDVDVLEMNEKQVVSLYVQEYPVKPVSVKGRYYKRQANSNHLMSAVEIADMSLQTKNSSWDYYLDAEHTINDIDFDTVNRAINQMNRHGMTISELPTEYFRKKGLCDENGRLTFGSYLLFKRDEDLLTTIELGCFQDKDGILIKDSARSKSNLVKQVNDVMDFVKKHINMAVLIMPNQVENLQKWDYPLEAIREIVLNMIVHRDYRSAADSVVKIFPDHIEFYNPGTLPNGMTIEELMSNRYKSQPRNKQIADIFKDMGDIEKYGSGIKRVVGKFIAEGLPVPKWELVSDGVCVTVWKKENLESDKVTDQESDKEKVEFVDKEIDKKRFTDQESDKENKENDKESKRIKTLLDIMGDEPLTAKELMEVLNLKHTNSFLQNYLNPAIRLGFVKMTHPENPKHRNQRYYKVRKQ